MTHHMASPNCRGHGHGRRPKRPLAFRRRASPRRRRHPAVYDSFTITVVLSLETSVLREGEGGASSRAADCVSTASCRQHRRGGCRPATRACAACPDRRGRAPAAASRQPGSRPEDRWLTAPRHAPPGDAVLGTRLCVSDREPSRVAPVPDPSRAVLEGAHEGRLIVQRCTVCGACQSTPAGAACVPAARFE